MTVTVLWSYLLNVDDVVVVVVVGGIGLAVNAVVAGAVAVTTFCWVHVLPLAGELLLSLLLTLLLLLLLSCVGSMCCSCWWCCCACCWCCFCDSAVCVGSMCRCRWC